MTAAAAETQRQRTVGHTHTAELRRTKSQVNTGRVAGSRTRLGGCLRTDRTAEIGEGRLVSNRWGKDDGGGKYNII